MPTARLIWRCDRPHAHFSRSTSFNLSMLVRCAGIACVSQKKKQAKPIVENMGNTTAKLKTRRRFARVIARFGMVITHSGKVITHSGNTDQVITLNQNA
jgi:hypothetical protein